ncbi:MAG: DUF5317 domain-containing protein [Dehalobacterium sp.]
MLYEAILVAIVVGFVARGRISNLAHMKLFKIWLVFLSFFIQIGMEYLGARGVQLVFDYGIYLYGFSYLLLFIFLWINRHLPGNILLSLGFFLNFLVIMLNGGAMPVTLEGLDHSYVTMLKNNELPTYKILDGSAKLPWLSDVFIIPWPKGKAFSIGDIFISIGVFWLVFKTMINSDNYSRLISVRGMKLR